MSPGAMISLITAHKLKELVNKTQYNLIAAGISDCSAFNAIRTASGKFRFVESINCESKLPKR